MEIDRDKLQPYGLHAGEVAEVLETALSGRIVGEIVDGQRRHDIVMRLPEEARASPEALGRIPIDTDGGGPMIPLSAVAEIHEARGPNQILRENASRRIVIQCNVSGKSLSEVVGNIRTLVTEHVPLPEGYFISYGGQFESQERASRLIALLFLLSLAGMTMVLYVHFRSWPLTAQVLLNIPFALIGAVIAVALSGGVLSIASLVAFVTLCGIAARNGIMMISHYLHLMRHEGERFDKAMVVRGSLERLVPVLMTAGTAMLALIPLLLSAGQPGRELLHPVAVVVFGGLLSSTLLDIVLTPAVFWRFGRRSVENIFRNECPEILPRVFGAAASGESKPSSGQVGEFNPQGGSST